MKHADGRHHRCHQDQIRNRTVHVQVELEASTDLTSGVMLPPAAELTNVSENLSTQDTTSYYFY